MNRHKTKGLFPSLVFLLITILLVSLPAEAARVVLLKGLLVTENCVKDGKLSSCYLEEAANGPWVLFADDRKVYKIVLHRAEQWKLDNGFGKQVVIKGVLKGNRLLVIDVAALGGKKKLSKACL